jgi:hypothetical protein
LATPANERCFAVNWYVLDAPIYSFFNKLAKKINWINDSDFFWAAGEKLRLARKSAPTHAGLRGKILATPGLSVDHVDIRG